MKITSPTVIDEKVMPLLRKLGAEHAPEFIPVRVEPDATVRNCFSNVLQKMSRDGGKIQYGWAVYQSEILCEAEWHAVWENTEGKRIDITPRDWGSFNSIMFVPDNRANDDSFKDNVRINITHNPIVNDYILLSATIQKIHSFGERIDEHKVEMLETLVELIASLEEEKLSLERFIYRNGTANEKCFCNSGLPYSQCHGHEVKKKMRKILHIAEEYQALFQHFNYK